MKEQEQEHRLVKQGAPFRYRKGQSGNPIGRPCLPENLPLRQALIAGAPKTLARLDDLARQTLEQAKKAEGGEKSRLYGVSLEAHQELLRYQLGRPWVGSPEELEQARGKRKPAKATSPSRMPALATPEKAAPTAPQSPADNTHYVNSGGQGRDTCSVSPPSAGPPPLAMDGEDIEVI